MTPHHLPSPLARPFSGPLTRRLGAAVTATVTVTAALTAVGTVGAGAASAGPCSVMFGNFGSLLESTTGAGMPSGSLGSLGSSDDSGSLGSLGSSGSSGSLGSLGSSGSSGSLASVSSALGSADRSGSLVRQLETGSLGNGLSGSLDPLVGSVYGMPPWITGEEGTVPVLRGPTRFLQLVTGPTSPDETISRFGVTGTDLGIMWDNGDAADPEILMAFGDTMGDCSVPGDQWRSNVLFRSQTPGDELGGGIRIASAAMGSDGLAKSIVPRYDKPGEVTIIPTAGISVNGVQYLRFMSVAHWGQPGSWTTNYSGMAYSIDNGENWSVVPQMARRITQDGEPGADAPPVDSAWRSAQMSSFLKVEEGPGDGFLYEYLTPSGRQGAAILARVPLAGSPDAEALDGGTAALGGVLNPDAYEYWNGSGWVEDVTEARTVLPAPASEMSVMWNAHLGRYTAMYSQGYNSIVLRTADTPWGPWENATTLIDYSILPGVYGGFIHPWAQGSDLYYLVTTWNAYNVFLVRTELDEVFPNRGMRRSQTATEAQTEVVRQVPVSELVDGVVPTE